MTERRPRSGLDYLLLTVHLALISVTLLLLVLAVTLIISGVSSPGGEWGPLVLSAGLTFTVVLLPLSVLGIVGAVRWWRTGRSVVLRVFDLAAALLALAVAQWPITIGATLGFLGLFYLSSRPTPAADDDPGETVGGGEVDTGDTAATERP
ncbi:MAG: hypothetical protein ACJ761_10530 [Chloroflexota bacterium]